MAILRVKDIREKKLIGQLGERLAASGIVKMGYTILEMNYQAHHVGEIDIIHREENKIVFSEVKTFLSEKNWGEPIDQMDEKKRDRIVESANKYLEEKGIDQHIRFDVISIQYFHGKPKITRIKGGLPTV